MCDSKKNIYLEKLNYYNSINFNNLNYNYKINKYNHKLLQYGGLSGNEKENLLNLILTKLRQNSEGIPNNKINEFTISYNNNNGLILNSNEFIKKRQNSEISEETKDKLKNFINKINIECKKININIKISSHDNKSKKLIIKCNNNVFEIVEQK